jgi:TfoX/Sxy family transcriptional regulator of competence genes
MDYILEQLAGVSNISSRKMFGEYALYCNGRVVGFVCDDNLLIKITPPGKEFVGEYYAEGRPYPGAKPYMLIDGDRIEDREWLCEFIHLTAANVPLPKKKTKKNSI